jgi:hypothetical protein
MYPVRVYTRIMACGAVLFLFFLSSCAGSRATGEWKDPELGAKKFRHILVIGVAKQEEKRKFYEDEFAKQLNRLGVLAIASHNILPHDKMQDKDAIMKSIAGLGVDGVIITRLLGIKEEGPVTLGKTYKVPYGYYNKMNDYYDKSYSDAPPESYTETHKFLQLETNLYDAETEKLAFSIKTDSFLRQEFQKSVMAYIEIVVGKLEANHLF